MLRRVGHVAIRLDHDVTNKLLRDQRSIRSDDCGQLFFAPFQTGAIHGLADAICDSHQHVTGFDIHSALVVRTVGQQADDRVSSIQAKDTGVTGGSSEQKGRVVAAVHVIQLTRRRIILGVKNVAYRSAAELSQTSLFRVHDGPAIPLSFLGGKLSSPGGRDGVKPGLPVRVGDVPPGTHEAALFQTPHPGIERAVSLPFTRFFHNAESRGMTGMVRA